MPKVQPVKVTYADGRTELVKASKFAKRSYAQYLLSPHWRDLRRAALERDGFRCCGCRASSDDKRLEVHHLTYVRLGRERLEDLVVLCQRCHATEHQWQRRRA